MEAAPPLPSLPSLARKPSWTNRAGRIDRSACLELRASELWRLIGPSDWRCTRSDFDLQAHATIVISAAWLFHLHNSRMPFTLSGDHRTPKSNAMKNPDQHLHSGDGRRRHKKSRDQPWIASSGVDDPLYANPNKGGAQSKRLALWSGDEVSYQHLCEWKQTIRIERWSRKKRSEIKGQKSEIRGPRARSIRARGRAGSLRYPVDEHFLICPQCTTKRKKLFLPLAHVQEVDDAEIAEGWIKLIDAHPHFRRRLLQDAALRRQHTALIDRYGPLLRAARRLICADCLGLRWGEVKKSRSLPPYQVAALRAERGAARKAKIDAKRQAQSDEFITQLARELEPRLDPQLIATLKARVEAERIAYEKKQQRKRRRAESRHSNSGGSGGKPDSGGSGGWRSRQKARVRRYQSMPMSDAQRAGWLKIEDHIKTLYEERADRHPVTRKHLDVLLEKLELLTAPTSPAPSAANGPDVTPAAPAAASPDRRVSSDRP